MKFLFFALIAVTLSVTANAQAGSDSAILSAKGEREAAFPGGDGAWKEFLAKNLKPDNAIDAVPKKKKHFIQIVTIRFIVNTDGSLTNYEVEEDAHPDIIAEALRVLKKSPKWIPAVQNGKYVKAYRRQPLTFSFE